MELRERIEAHNKRERKEWFRTAWLASRMISYMTGKEVDISDLLPEMFPAKVWTKEEIKKELDDLKKRLKVK